MTQGGSSVQVKELGLLRNETSTLLLAARKTSAATGTTLRGCIRALGAGPLDPVALVAMLRRLSEHIGDFRATIGSLEGLTVDWANVASRHLDEAESDFRTVCADRGWKVDGTWPTLFVDRAVRVHFDVGNDVADVGGIRARPMSMNKIVAILAEAVPTLLPKDHSAHSFAQQLTAAYDVLARSSPQVPIWHLYREVVMQMQPARFWRDAQAKAFVPLSADQFRARLSHALAENVAAGDGRCLRLLPPISDKDGLFLFQPSEGRFGYVGRVEFLPPASE